MIENHREIEKKTGRPWWDQKEGDIKCPRCESNDINELSKIVTKHSDTSIPKGIGGGRLFSKKGAISGALMGSDKPEYDKYYYCRACGHEWK